MQKVVTGNKILRSHNTSIMISTHAECVIQQHIMEEH